MAHIRYTKNWDSYMIVVHLWYFKRERASDLSAIVLGHEFLSESTETNMDYDESGRLKAADGIEIYALDISKNRRCVCLRYTDSVFLVRNFRWLILADWKLRVCCCALHASESPLIRLMWRYARVLVARVIVFKTSARYLARPEIREKNWSCTELR